MSSIKSPGQQLKEAREQLGKSQSDMAKVTRISIQQLQGLEDDHYESIPAPMYVRGFIKLYAKELGIRPDPLVDLYEKIRKGEALTGEEPVVPPPAPAPVSEREPIIPRTQRVSPEFSVEEGLASEPVAKWDWQVWLQKIPLPRINLDPEILRRPQVRYALIGVGILCLLLLVRSCVKGKSDPGEETATPESPVVENPLLSPPEPVYYQLPSSYQ